MSRRATPAAKTAADTDALALLRRRLRESVEVKDKLATVLPDVARAGEALVAAYRAGKKAIFFGNGGSAADAQHFAAELVGRYYTERRALPAVALTVNTSSLTAIANDYGYHQVFVRQLEAYGQPGDVAVAISTSGDSKNVVEAVRAAKGLGLVTIGLTGEGGGALKQLVDHCVRVPSKDTPRVQECHLFVGHLWCEMIEEAFGEPREKQE